jgi:Holliday junction resolvasome RuvABC DNA-binding subunit
VEQLRAQQVAIREEIRRKIKVDEDSKERELAKQHRKAVKAVQNLCMKRKQLERAIADLKEAEAQIAELNAEVDAAS